MEKPPNYFTVRLTSKSNHRRPRCRRREVIRHTSYDFVKRGAEALYIINLPGANSSGNLDWRVKKIPVDALAHSGEKTLVLCVSANFNVEIAHYILMSLLTSDCRVKSKTSFITKPTSLSSPKVEEHYQSVARSTCSYSPPCKRIPLCHVRAST